MCEVDIDYQGTINEYIKDGKKPAAINPPTLVWDYLIYYCPRCQARFKYTYRDVEYRVRQYFMELSDKYREYFEAKEEYDIDEDREISRNTQISPPTASRIERLYSKKD
jgi:hypothetical protein